MKRMLLLLLCMLLAGCAAETEPTTVPEEIDAPNVITVATVDELLDAIKFDNGSGTNKWFTIGDSDWAPMSKDLYGEILFRYKIQTDNLVPIEEYYLQ